jgi:hypothetical protein
MCMAWSMRPSALSAFALLITLMVVTSVLSSYLFDLSPCVSARPLWARYCSPFSIVPTYCQAPIVSGLIVPFSLLFPLLYYSQNSTRLYLLLYIKPPVG